MAEWHAARDLVAAERGRCLQAVAAALGVAVAQLPHAIARAVFLLGHESFTAGVRYAHEAPTIPPRPMPPERRTGDVGGVTRVGWPRKPRG